MHLDDLGVIQPLKNEPPDAPPVIACPISGTSVALARIAHCHRGRLASTRAGPITAPMPARRPLGGSQWPADRAPNLARDTDTQPDQHRDRPAPGLGRAGYQLHFTAAERGRTQRRFRPSSRHYVDSWLQIQRPAFQSVELPNGADQRSQPPLARPLGATREQPGDPAADQAVYQQAFGKPIWPHLFRDYAVAELVDTAPRRSASPPTARRHSENSS
jgi:hypothetical protein